MVTFSSTTIRLPASGIHRRVRSLELGVTVLHYGALGSGAGPAPSPIPPPIRLPIKLFSVSLYATYTPPHSLAFPSHSLCHSVAMTCLSTLRSLERTFGEKFLRVWFAWPTELFRELLYHFTVRELCILARLPAFAFDAQNELKSRLGCLMDHWALDVDSTLSMFEKTGAIMSGSGVLYVCVPGKWWPGDLDFYCERGTLQDVLQFFETQGYKRDSDSISPEEAHGAGVPRDENYCMDLLHSVLTLTHRQRGTKINLVESSLPSSEAPVLVFHSTQVMNFITAKGVVCLYPEWTTKMKGIVCHPAGRVRWKENEAKEELVLTKYRKRGYEMTENCADLHVEGARVCSVCTPLWTGINDEAKSMVFEGTGLAAPLRRRYMWRLGGYHHSVHTLPNGQSTVQQRGAMVVVQGDNAGRMLLYKGLTGTVTSVNDSELLRVT
ncbi:hypothetical protein NMY22_g14482 [Coprinellus aureogranulatus]|nr:hypothetical protein NMY22_g14482 [Coprinellus aureogranulatus]